jgi:hypothetical protein
MKIGKQSKELFFRCQGNCNICFDDGDCSLQRKINKWGKDQVKKIVYMEEA